MLTWRVLEPGRCWRAASAWQPDFVDYPAPRGGDVYWAVVADGLAYRPLGACCGQQLLGHVGPGYSSAAVAKAWCARAEAELVGGSGRGQSLRSLLEPGIRLRRAGRLVSEGDAMPRFTRTGMTTADGLRVYDLEPLAAALVAVAGPDNHTGLIDADALPPGFRWVDEDEWGRLQSDLAAR